MGTIEFIIGKYNYWVYIILMMVGFYAMIAKHNLVKKLIGMNIFQWAIILYYVSIGSKKRGSYNTHYSKWAWRGYTCY